MDMVLLMIVVILLSFGVVGGLFVLMKNEQKPVEDEVVPITDIDEIKKELGAYEKPEGQDAASDESEAGFDRDGFDPNKPLEGIEKEVHDIVESSREIVDVPLEKLMEDMEQNPTDSSTGEALTGEHIYVEKINALQEENQTLAERFNRIVDEKSALEAKMRDDSLASQDDLVRSQETIDRLNQEIEHLKASFTKDDVTEADNIRQNYEEQIAELNDRLDELGRQYEQAKQDAEAVLKEEKTSSSSDEDVAKLQKMNVQLMERVQQLQYELTKNKAHITGLEKMCENYRLQLEDVKVNR